MDTNTVSSFIILHIFISLVYISYLILTKMMSNLQPIFVFPPPQVRYGKGKIENYGFLAAVALFLKALQSFLACRRN